MTVIHPNSISGIASVTSHSNSLYFYESDHSTKLTINAHVNGDVTATNGTFSGDVTVGGTLTYDDVTNIDSVGIITANAGIYLDDSIIHLGDTNTKIRFPAADTITAETGGSERLRITSAGDVGIGYNTPTVKLHIREAASGVSSYDNRYHCIIEDDAEAYYGVYVPNNGYGGLRVIDGSGNIGSRLDYYVNENQMHYQCVGDHIFSTTGNAERLRITDAGRLLLGTTTEGHVSADDFTVAGSGDSGITIRSGSGSEGSIMFSDATSGNGEYQGWINYNHNSNFMRFFTNATERLRIRSDGKTLIGGATSPYSEYNGTNSGWNGGHYINVGGSTQWGTLHIADWDDSTTKDSYGGTNIFLSRCKSETIGDHSGGALGANNPIARLLFNGSDGSDFRNAAWIESKVDGTPGSNNMPGLLSFATSSGSGAAPVERLRITSDGNLGIGNDASFGLYTQTNDRNLILGTGSGSSSIQVHSSTSGWGGLYFGDATSGTARYSGAVEYNHNSNYLRFFTNQVERLRITSAGLVGVNCTPLSQFQVKAGSNANIGLTVMSNEAAIEAFNDAGSSNVPLRLRGSALKVYTSSTERLQIYADGRVRIRAINANSNFTVSNTSGTVQILDDTEPSAVGTGGKIVFGSKYHTGSNTMGTAFIGSYKENAPSNGSNEYEHSLIFGTNSSNHGFSERMRIRHDGRVHIGDSLGNNHSGMFQVIHEGGGQLTNDCLSYFETNSNDWLMILNSNEGGSASHYHIYFMEEGSTRGQIAGSHGSNVNYTQGSDYRWKENIIDLTGTEGIDICKRLRPRKYNWIKNREGTGQINTVDGFIAHEVQEAGVLGAVIGEKDAVNEDGSINGQMLDYGQMTPVLAAAIKGLIAKVETLEAQVTALQGS